MKKVFLKLMSTVFFILPISLLLTSCLEEHAIDVQSSKALIKDDLVMSSGIYFKPGENVPIGMGLFGESVTNGDLFNVIDTWEYYKNTDASKVDVYIDMSQGVDMGIKQSQEHMQSLTLALENNATYYKVGGSDSDKGEYKPEPLNVTDYMQAYTTFTDSRKFKDGRSKLKAGLQACVNNKDNITVFITDFLLDEGKVRKKPQDAYSNITSRLFEDGNPWAISEFSGWFKENNILEIISVEHTLPVTYGCVNPRGCSKQIYYMIFTPAKLVGMNSAINDVVEEIKSFEKTNYLKIDPLAFGVRNEDPSGVGDVSYDYLKTQKPMIISNYKVQFTPFNIPLMTENISDKEGFTVYQDITLINNLIKIDRDNDNSSPYRVELNANFYDVTELFYQLGAINKGELTTAGMKFDPNDYPGNLVDQGDGHVKMIGARDLKDKNNLFSYNEEENSITMNANTLQTQSYWGGDKKHGKLYMCDIIINDISFDKYDQENLSWIFWHKSGGYLENISLTQSISKALYANKNNYKGKTIYSYLIALNDNQ